MSFTIAFKMPSAKGKGAIELSIEQHWEATTSGSLKEAVELAVEQLMSQLPDQDQGFELVGDESDSATAGSSLVSTTQLPNPKNLPYKPSTRDPTWLDRLTYASRCGAASAKLLEDQRADSPQEVKCSE